MSNENGKGDSPRNIFSTEWRNNYDQIDWAEYWKVIEYGTLLTDYDGNDILVSVGTVVKILRGNVYLIDNGKEYGMNITQGWIRNCGRFERTTK
jgi:hypothetical protein